MREPPAGGHRTRGSREQNPKTTQRSFSLLRTHSRSQWTTLAVERRTIQKGTALVMLRPHHHPLPHPRPTRRAATLGLGITLVLALAADPLLPSRADAEEVHLDTVLRNGTVFDGTGAEAYKGDVGIKDGFIVDVGDLSDVRASREIDVEGLFVTPGFINMHSHADEEDLPAAENILTQGITTEFLYPDGGGPVEPWTRLNELEGDGFATNVGAWVGFGAVWTEVVGEGDRRPTEDETTEMRGMVERALEEGAWGVTTNLDSAPQTYADTQEVIDVIRAAHGWRAGYQSHLRSEGTAVIEALEEAIQIGEQTGTVPLWTHAKAEGPPNHGKSIQALQVMDDALDRGTYVAGDVYPYIYGASSLARRFVPRWAADGGIDAMLERFADPELRSRIAEETEELIEIRLGGPQNILLRQGEYINEYLHDVAEQMDVRPGEAVMRLVEAEGSDLSMNYWYGDEADVLRLLDYPTIAAGCDCGATTAEATHPRNYGSFPKFLGEYTRERNLLSYEEMIRKLTGLPATQMGLVDRGFIAEGMIADITVFDPETVTDTNTVEVPRQYSEGMEYVFVNGELALENGEVTGAEAGEIVERAPNMVSRPESSAQTASLSAEGPLVGADIGFGEGPVHVSLSVMQTPGGVREATGEFELVDEAGQKQFESVSIGQVQATDHWSTYSQTGAGWASFTGVGELSSGDIVPFLVVAEESDPWRDGESTLTIRIGDRDAVSGQFTSHGAVEVGLNAVPTRVDTGIGGSATKESGLTGQIGGALLILLAGGVVMCIVVVTTRRRQHI